MAEGAAPLHAPQRPKPGLTRVLGGWALFLAVETATQVVFKLAGAGLDLEGGVWAMALGALQSPYVLAGFALYFAGFLIWMTILREGDLGRAYPLTSLMYVTTLIAAVVLFHETLNTLRILGVAAIMGGVVILSGDENSPGATPGPASGAPMPAASHEHE